MTQEGQALPSPTPTENPVEPNTAGATADPPAETQRLSQADTQLVARASEDQEEAKQQQEEKEESREGEEEETQREGERRGSDDGGEGDVDEEKLDCAGGKKQQTEVQVKGESEGTRGDGCADVEVISTSTGEKVDEMEGEVKEEEEGKDNGERYPPAEAPQQAERWVYFIIFMYRCCS